jgi:hypothetical protein
MSQTRKAKKRERRGHRAFDFEDAFYFLNGYGVVTKVPAP